MPALRRVDIDLLDAAGCPNIGRLLDALAEWLIPACRTVRHLYLGLHLGHPDWQHHTERFVRDLPPFPAGLDEGATLVFKSHLTLEYVFRDQEWRQYRVFY